MPQQPGPGPAQPRILLSVEEAAQRLSMGRTTVFKLLANGDLDSVRIGRLRRIPAESIANYVRTLSQQ